LKKTKLLRRAERKDEMHLCLSQKSFSTHSGIKLYYNPNITFCQDWNKPYNAENASKVFTNALKVFTNTLTFLK